MFSVQRFDGEGSSQDASRSNVPDRIALINQRKALQQRSQGQSSEASSSKVTLATPAFEVSNSNGIQGSAINTATPAILPSRLAVSHTLRQADRQAKIAANGGVKEKTKAKQRYLKTKKDRRKKRKAAEASKGKKGGKQNKIDGPSEKTGEDDSSNSDSVSGHEDDILEDERIEVPEAKRQKRDVSERADRVDRDDMEMRAGSPSSSSSAASDSSTKSSGSTSGSDEPSNGEDLIEEEKASQAKEADMVIDTQEVIVKEPEVALSRFPAPKRTLQVSRKELAAQGLPSGLANPDRIDPTITISVKKNDHANLDQISASMKSRLAKIGITEWFAVQTAVIPRLLAEPQSKSLYPNPPLADLCVSAPTGSGKTLSYAVPVVEVLSNRLCRRLRALVILPTRELVNQVRDTFLEVSKGSSLSIIALTGQQSFQQEQVSLVDAESVKQKKTVAGLGSNATVSKAHSQSHEEISSLVDILITTPGRLIDHLDVTPGFTLQHLRFLIIDEADRLLGQSFQEWLPRLLDALDPSRSRKEKVKEDKKNSRMERLAPAWLHYKSINEFSTRYIGNMRLQDDLPIGVQKLLFSATLTRDPAKILALQLRNATFISVEGDEQNVVGGEDETPIHGSFIDRQETFALPVTLREHMIVTNSSEKPLDLLHLLYNPDRRLRQVLCFTKSVENANRLVNLIQLHGQSQNSDNLIAKEYSSDLNNTERSRILKEFKEEKIDVLICSDVMARGMDLPNVRHVISYDVPVDMAKYVHRVGRTARANQDGHAWTLVEEQEARHFKTMIKRGGRKGNMEKVKIQSEERDALRESYQEALGKLEQLYSRQ